MKKVIALILVCGLVIGMSPAAWAGPVYKDVASGHWAEKDIAKMKAKGVVSGLPDGGYSPNEAVTREQAIVMILKVIGKGGETAGKQLPADFKDAAKISSWAKESVALGVELGIISQGDTLDFRPQEATKRFEMAVFVGRALGLTAADYDTEELTFSDAAKIPNYAKNYVAAVVNEGLMGGMSDGTFAPNGALSRAQMASLLVNLDNRLDKLSNLGQRGVVFSVSSTSNSLLLENEEGIIETIQLAPDAYIYKEGSSSLHNLDKGDGVSLVFNSQGQASYIEVGKALPPKTPTTITVSGTIESVQLGSPTVVAIKDGAGVKSYDVDVNAQLVIDNLNATTAQLAKGQEVTAVVENNKITELNGTNSDLTQEISGEISLITRGSQVTLKVEETDGNENSYTLGSSTKIYLDYKASSADNLLAGQEVIMYIQGGEISQVFATSIEWEAEGILVSTAFAPERTVTLKDEDGNTQSYTLEENARIRRNSSTVTLRDLLPGDAIELELKNNKVSYVYAKKVKGEAKGKVSAITIARTSTITIINSEGWEETYQFDSDTRIRKDRKRIDISQVKAGDYVILDLEGEVVGAIDVEARYLQSYVVGTINNINSRAKVVVIEAKDEDEEFKQVYLDSKTYLIKLNENIRFSDLEEGDEVIAVGEYDAGIFTASSVIVIGGLE